MEERIPGQWAEGPICPTYKQEDCLACENYHGISLFNTAYKVFSNIVFQRRGPYAEKIVGNYQCGFKDGKSTSDEINTIRQILEKMGEYGINILHLFMDFKAAYDFIGSTQISRLWRNFKFPENLENRWRSPSETQEAR
jgi:sorting nexin-29